MTHPTSGRTTGYQLSPPASAHDTITKVIKELRAYNPQADEHGGKFIHKAPQPPSRARADGFFLLLPQRPKPEAPAGAAGLDWDAYSGAQMLAFGRECSDAAIAALRTQQPAPATQQAGWTNADADAARLALELECLLMDTKDTAIVSKWWQSANDALELHRARLQEVQPSPTPQADSQPAKVELFNPLEGGNLETELQMAAVIALRDSQPALPEITAEDRSFLHYNPNTDDIVEWVQHYASAAITADRAMRAQAAHAAVAAAPELLAALVELRDWYTEHTGLPAAAANAAIAKAVQPNAPSSADAVGGRLE